MIGRRIQARQIQNAIMLNLRHYNSAHWTMQVSVSPDMNPAASVQFTATMMSMMASAAWESLPGDLDCDEKPG